MPPVRQNFRGARALIVHRPDANRQRLEVDLRRLGLLVGCVDPGVEGAAFTTEAIQSCDILFYDADQGTGDLLPKPLPDIPLVALVGVEAPSRLSRVVQMRTAAALTKPVGSTGLFTALFMAFNEHALRRRETAERRGFEARLKGRRYVVKAVLALMREQAVDDDTAFHLLRRESMRQRVTLEDYCRSLLSAADDDPADDRQRSAR